MMNSIVLEIAQGDYSSDDDSSDEGIIVNSPCLEKRPPPPTLALPLVTRNQTRAMNSAVSMEGRMVHSPSSSLCYRVLKPHCNSHPNQTNNRSSSKKKPSPPLIEMKTRELVRFCADGQTFLADRADQTVVLLVIFGNGYSRQTVHEGDGCWRRSRAS